MFRCARKIGGFFGKPAKIWRVWQKKSDNTDASRIDAVDLDKHKQQKVFSQFFNIFAWFLPVFMRIFVNMDSQAMCFDVSTFYFIK